MWFAGCTKKTFANLVHLFGKLIQRSRSDNPGIDGQTAIPQLLENGTTGRVLGVHISHIPEKLIWRKLPEL